jgi:DNA-binding MarR family transcriptional regulator
LLEFAMAVKAMHRELERINNEAMRPLGLTGPQADALVAISISEPVSLKELGGLLIAEAGAPSRLVERLVEAGLVERVAAEGDRRRIELSLTPEGRRVLKRVMAARERILALARQAFGGHDPEPVLKLFRELLSPSPLGDVIARRRELTKGGAGVA